MKKQKREGKPGSAKNKENLYKSLQLAYKT